MNLKSLTLLIVPFLCACQRTAEAADYYVSPTGSSTGNGSLTRPWNLQTALNRPSTVVPGDTIYLRGGTYKGSFVSKLAGTSTKPITVKSYPNEWAIIDIASLTDVASRALRISGAWSVFRDLEVTNSATGRQYSVSGARVPGVHNIDVLAPNVKLINLVIHDATHCGIGLQEKAVNAEVYGCLIYNNGTSKLEHGIYAGGVSPNVKKIADNIIFNNAGNGLTVHSSSQTLMEGYLVEGNTVLNNGLLHSERRNWNLGVGTNRFERVSVVNNFSYRSSPALDLQMEYGSVNKDIEIRGNYFAGGILRVTSSSPAAMTNNQFVGSSSVLTFDMAQSASASFRTWNSNGYFAREDSGRPFKVVKSSYSFEEWKKATGLDANSFYASGRPRTVDVFMRPNLYEAGRANLIVYNWPMQDFVDVNVKSVLSPGARYQVINAQDPFSEPVLSGVYNGEPLRLPLKGLSVASTADPKHPRPPSATSPEFGAFVLVSN
jgi:hypothetical protein